MSLLGPVFFYDLVRQSRRPFIPILRIAYLSGLFLVLCVSAFFWSSRYPQGLPPLVVARFIESFFNNFLLVQFVFVVGLTPALTAGALTEEKEGQTLPFLLASPLHRHEIVLGKLASRLLTLLLVVLAGLPVFSLLQLLGGVDPGWLWAGFAATAATMLSLASVSLFWSAALPRSRDAVLFAYLTFPVYMLLAGASRLLLQPGWAEFPSTATWDSPVSLADVVRAFNAGEPIQAVRQALQSTRVRGWTVGEIVRDYALFHGIVALLAVAVATFRLRRESGR